MQPLASLLVWSGISVLGAAAFGVLALSRGETVNAAWLLTAAVCTYAVGYRFYSTFLANRVFGLDDRRATPAERCNNGRDFVPTNKWVLYGHHFAAIAGAGPLVGPVAAGQRRRGVGRRGRPAAGRVRRGTTGGIHTLSLPAASPRPYPQPLAPD